MARPYYVYILSNRHRTVLYVGLTNDLKRRLGEHKTKHYPQAFSAQYNVNELVYYETFSSPHEARARELQLKSWSRKKKLWLIRRLNPELKDISADVELGQ